MSKEEREKQEADIEMTDEQRTEEVKPIVRNYQAVYGYRLEKVLVELLQEMKAAGDGNAMMLLQGQLVEAVRLIREKIGAIDMVVLSDDDLKKQMM